MKGLAWLCILSIICFPILSGCADKEIQTHYYDTEYARTELLIESVKEQSRSNADLRIAQMQAFSTAVSSAAATESPTDDALISMAWGIALGTPQGVTMPNLPPMHKPETSSDIVRAWSPLIGAVVPFLYPLVWGASGGGQGTRISADNGATVSMDSGNTGSYNRAGYDMTTTIDNTGNQGILNSQSTCEGEECGPGGVGSPTPPIEEGCTAEELATCIATAPAGFTPSGTALIAPGCSCNSRCAGEC